VARHAAFCGEYRFGRVHAVYVFGRCLGADEDDFLAFRLRGLSAVGGEDDLARSAAGAGRESAREFFRRFLVLRRHNRQQQLGELFRIHAQHGF